MGKKQNDTNCSWYRKYYRIIQILLSHKAPIDDNEVIELNEDGTFKYYGALPEDWIDVTGNKRRSKRLKKTKRKKNSKKREKRKEKEDLRKLENTNLFF